MKKMKKSTILSLATAGVIMVGTVGTFATWDKLSDTQTGKVTFAKPVTVTTSAVKFEMAKRSLGADEPEAKIPAEVTVENFPSDQANDYEIQFMATAKTDGALTIVNPTPVPLNADDPNQIYTAEITVKPKDTTVAGIEQEVDVKAELVEKPQQQ